VNLRVPPPILALLAAALMWTLDRWLPLAHWIQPPWNRVGALPAAIGFVIAIAAAARFRQAHTTVNPMDPSKATQLVTGGVFRFSRNPMYVGLALLLIGWAFWLNSASPWLIPPLFVIAITRFQIIPEEDALERLFGAQYAAYRQSVARWIGRSG
jgi:protein-S-isoprenylcysteine O-methyltransferase Ste14